MWNRVLPLVTKRRLAKPFGLDCDFPNCGHTEANENCSLHKAGRMIAFLAGLHDLGKCSPPFALRGKTKNETEQTRRLYDLYARTDCDCETFQPAFKVPHGYVTAMKLPSILEDEYRFPPRFARRVSEIIGGHHGIFATGDDLRTISDFHPEESFGGEPWDEARVSLFHELARLLDVSLDGLECSFPDLDNATSMVFAGFVSVADWIGSNADFFKCLVEDSTSLADHDLGKYLETSRALADKAVTDLGWKKWPRSTDLKDFHELFPKIEHKRDLQSKAVEIASSIDSPGIFIVEALMGEGKTETAMYLADVMNAKLGTRGIFFALPTQATSDQMFGRLAGFLKHRFEETDHFINLMLQHGHASLSDEFIANKKQFRKIQGIFDENESLSEKYPNIAAAEWFTYRKRGLLAPFGVGTVDQILFAALQTKHVFVRLFGLAHKTIIIDEVHAYDAYMSTLLCRLLEWLGAMGSPVVILSATLPKQRRTELIKAYLKGIGQDIGNDEMLTSTGDHDVYPRISFALQSTPEKTFNVTHLDTAMENTRSIAIEFKDEQTFVIELKQKLAGGGCAAVICNTVGRAQTIYELLKNDEFFAGSASDGLPKLDLLHSRFRLKDRRDRERRSMLRFGKEGTTVPFTENGIKVDHKVRRPDTAVLVSTQIIEQSLDIDFDIMVSDLAPADLLLQRAGRLQRHQRPDRKSAFCDPETGKPKAELWILRPPLDENDDIAVNEKGRPELGPSGLIYDPHILIRSWFTLRGRVKIDVPADVEDLIEMVYDGGGLPLDGLSENDLALLTSTRPQYEAGLTGQSKQAESHYISRPYFNGHLGKLLGKPKEEEAPELHPDSQAMTRLVEPTVQVACLWKKDGKLYLDDKYRTIVDLTSKDKPAIDLQKDIIFNSVSVSSKSVVFQFFDEPVPVGWQRSPLLRRHRYLEFDSDGKCEKFGHIFELNSDKGLLIGKKEES
jgi:CRISPR-associated endonuclease/helicase Cas3